MPLRYLRSGPGELLHGPRSAHPRRDHPGQKTPGPASRPPHLAAPKAYFEQVAHLDIPLSGPPPGATPVPGHVRGRWCGDWRLAPEQRREAIRAYLACVRFADEQVGRILDQLRDAGQEEDTLVILTSDHGFQLGEHGLWFKNFLYRESTGVPLVIADPRRPATHGRTCDALVSHTDLFPTLVDLFDLPEPDVPFDGRSYATLLDHPGNTVRDSLATLVDWGDIQGRAVRTPDQLDIEWTGQVTRTQRFDVRRDPGEHVDLLHPTQHPTTAPGGTNGEN